MNGGSGGGDDCLREIYMWLDEIPLSRPKRNIARDFSDGVLMAEILKRYYPKYVDIQNYFPGNSIAKKVDNWCTLSRRVFPKINIKLKKDVIEQLAQSKPGVIEKVLSNVRAKIIKDCNDDRNSLFKDCEDPDMDDPLKFVTNPEECLNQTVPKRVFLKLKRESDEKDEAIRILLKKVEHLESMLKFKEQRLEDLNTQLSSDCDKI
ncbi:sperm flagellar protein 1-like [Copidosoma floridanum]|uniref:sperm flagellar protein 1-like n=1 Tax=Copidosoma floridanum TaxID=29053 RepID=UPI0006C9A476|nr:sperm flagellar protein 1-like [Copidosoma floridanum]